MTGTPRRGLQFLLVTAAVCTLAGPSRTAARDGFRDFATVGSIVVRRVESRTVVVIPIAGPVKAKLSEPFRVTNRWRLYLTIEDARMSIRGSKISRPEGVLAISATEVSGDVRLAVDVTRLGDYGARRSEEGLILWIDDEPRPRAEMLGSLTGAVESPVVPTLARAAAEPVHARSSGGGWLRLVLLGILAAGGGLVLQRVRRDGLPEWAQAAGPRLRQLVGGKAAQESAARTPTRGTGRSPVIDPRGRSAEIGDAFRVEPDRPPSGIAALAASDDDRKDD